MKIHLYLTACNITEVKGIEKTVIIKRYLYLLSFLKKANKYIIAKKTTAISLLVVNKTDEIINTNIIDKFRIYV